MKLEITAKVAVPVRYLRANCGVRYWEDATVNGVEDTNGTLIPCREGESWCPIIDMTTGTIVNWRCGTEARIHYKVCDAGVYELLDESMAPVKKIDGYVPKMMAPGDEYHGFGDYVIMAVDKGGVIQKWMPDLTPFEDED